MIVLYIPTHTLRMFQDIWQLANQCLIDEVFINYTIKPSKQAT